VADGNGGFFGIQGGPLPPPGPGQLRVYALPRQPARGPSGEIALEGRRHRSQWRHDGGYSRHHSRRQRTGLAATPGRRGEIPQSPLLEINRQAATIAYINDLRFMMIVVIVSVPLLLLLRGPQQASPGH
jgi:hypothetical protein